MVCARAAEGAKKPAAKTMTLTLTLKNDDKLYPQTTELAHGIYLVPIAPCGSTNFELPLPYVVPTIMSGLPQIAK
jgi:hypothetical protein